MEVPRLNAINIKIGPRAMSMHQPNHGGAKNFCLQLHKQSGDAMSRGLHYLNTVITILEHAPHHLLDGLSGVVHGLLVSINSIECRAIP